MLTIFFLTTHILFFIAGMMHARREERSKTSHPNEHLLKVGSKWIIRERQVEVYRVYGDEGYVNIFYNDGGVFTFRKHYFLATAQYVSGPIGG